MFAGLLLRDFHLCIAILVQDTYRLNSRNLRLCDWGNFGCFAGLWMLWNWLCLGVFQSPDTSPCGLFLNGFKMATFMGEHMLCLIFIMIHCTTADVDCSSTETLSNPVHVTCDVCKFGVLS